MSKEVQKEQCCYGGIAHDCHAGVGCRIAERLTATPQPAAQQEPVAMYRNKCADGSRCLHGCHANEPCYTTPQTPPLTEEENSKLFDSLIDEMLAHSYQGSHDSAEKVAIEIRRMYKAALREALAEQYRKAMQDAIVGGTGIMKGGERIDPTSIYSDIVSDGGMDPRNQFDKPAQQAPDYAWPTIADYEKEVGFEVNIAFRSAWTVARTTNDLFKQMGSDT